MFTEYALKRIALVSSITALISLVCLAFLGLAYIGRLASHEDEIAELKDHHRAHLAKEGTAYLNLHNDFLWFKNDHKDCSVSSKENVVR